MKAKPPSRVEFSDLVHDDDGRMLLDGQLFSGVAVERWPSGAPVSEIPFLQGLQHGVMRSWYSDGSKWSETDYRNGCVVGMHREWHENGALRLEEEIQEKGRRTRVARWDEDGKRLE